MIMKWRCNAGKGWSYCPRVVVTLGLLVAALTPVNAQNVNAPTWSGVMLSGQEVQYFLYYNGSATETATSTGFGGSATATQLANTSRPPAYYTVRGGTGAGRSTCGLTDQPSKPIYWYSDGTSSATHIGSQTPLVYPSAPSDEFNATRLESGLKGVEFLGSFLGSGSVSGTGSYIVEAVFYSDRACTDGGFEYGFFRRVLPSPEDKIFFYYSDFTNCDGGICRATNSSTGTVENPNVREHSITDLALNSHSENKYYFHAYPVSNGGGYDMRFEVLDPYTFGYAQCKVDGASTAGDCFKQYDSSDGTIAFSNFNDVSGYAFTTAQSVGTVSASTTFQLYVEELKVGK
jgi:hypothetical protein